MAECEYPNGDLLVSATWLAQHLHDPNQLGEVQDHLAYSLAQAEAQMTR